LSIACLRAITEVAVVAVVIDVALDARPRTLVADFVEQAGPFESLVAQAPTAPLFAITEHPVVAFGIGAAIGGPTCVGLFEADLASGAWVRVVGLAKDPIDACLRAITE
jgi:hypothetical protein